MGETLTKATEYGTERCEPFFLIPPRFGGRQELERRVEEHLGVMDETLDFASERLEAVPTDVLPASELEVREAVMLRRTAFTVPINYCIMAMYRNRGKWCDCSVEREGISRKSPKHY